MDIDGNQGKSRNFKAAFYRRHVNGATRNYTYQISNLRVDNNAPIQFSSDKSVSISCILDVGTNG
ncbi:MAG TPA: hypothetical protein VFJ51_14275 [Nitrososphaeraceae archaeon]|nr:hypothetical protein [Nitrososphaeraceae archaeon]